MKEQWTRGISDYVDNNGVATQYVIYVLKNGDTFSTRGTVLARGVGPGKQRNMTVSYITEGTGKLAGIQGIVHTTGSAEPKAGMNETEVEIEYSIGKMNLKDRDFRVDALRRVAFNRCARRRLC